MRTKPLLVLAAALAVTTASCSTVGAAFDAQAVGASVKRTSNADQVKGCERVARYNGDTQLGQMIGSDDPSSWTVYLPAGGGVAEVYDRCK